jgi:CRISPR-associated protein Csd1
VTGGLATGTVLVGCDKEAFASYGFQHAENAAMSDKTANAYVEALNDLLRHHSRSLGNVQVVYWFKKTVPPDEDPVAFLMEPSSISEREAQHRAAEFLDALRVGKLTDLAGNHYYALTISGSGGRVMVRDWMEGQFEQLGKNVAAWFDDLTIVQSDGRQLARLVRFREVLAATARQLDDVPANRAACLWRVALGNLPITTEVLSQALMHNTLDVINNRQPNYARLGLLKAYHIRKMRKEGGVSMSNNVEPMLNENHPAPAYHCGRLLAVLAELQHSALGEVGAGVVQRYYAAASSTPGLVLGRLVRTSQFHLDKLDRGLARWYENQLAAIWGRLGDQVPRTLNLEEQSLFALGYYQQLAHMRSRGRGATSPTLQPASASPEAQSEEK